MDAAGEREAVLRAKAGDREAFAALVHRYARRVHDLARRMLRDAGEAEDVVQHAFWNAWRAMDRFDPARPFRNWLLRTASNLCRNRLAARQRRPVLRPLGGEGGPPEPSAPPAPERAAGSGRIREALDALPERYRLPMILRYVHDLPLEAIAEITGVGVATVKTHLHRGRHALRSHLDVEGDETRPPAGGTTR